MWEYKAVCFDNKDMFWRNGTLVAVKPPSDPRSINPEESMEEILNAIGAEGWEIVWVSDNMRRYLFKRKLTAKEAKKKNGKQVSESA